MLKNWKTVIVWSQDIFRLFVDENVSSLGPASAVRIIKRKGTSRKNSRAGDLGREGEAGGESHRES